MRRWTLRLLPLLVVVIAGGAYFATRERGTIYFAPVYTTPSQAVLSAAKWTTEQEPVGLPDRIQVVTGDAVPKAPGDRPDGAMVARIAPDDVTTGSGGSDRKRRSEVLWDGRQFRAGDEVWVSFPFYVPPSTPLSGPGNPWSDIFQWHGTDRLSPPVYLGIAPGGRFIIDSGVPGQGDIDFGAVRPGTWQRITLGVHFATDGAGWVEAVLDGRSTGRRAQPTLIDAGQRVYAKQGLYESSDWAGTDRTVVHGPIRIGSTESVVTGP